MSSIYIYWNKLIHIKNSNLNIKFEKIGKVIVSKNFSENKTTELFKILNTIVIYSAINDLEKISKSTKEKNMVFLKKAIKDLVNKYKSDLNKNSIIINKSNSVKKTETIAEKIQRINKANKKLRKETIAEKIQRINTTKRSIKNSMK